MALKELDMTLKINHHHHLTTLCLHHIFLEYYPNDGQQDCLQLHDTTNNTVMHILVHVSLLACIRISFEIYIQEQNDCIIVCIYLV